MKVGTIGWQDLTVSPDKVETVREFYEQVVGWESSEQEGDYNMMPPDSDQPAAGVCQAVDSNANLPAQWLVYIVVESVDQSSRRCLEMGGEVLDGPRRMGEARFCVIKDPAGAVCALYQP